MEQTWIRGDRNHLDDEEAWSGKRNPRRTIRVAAGLVMTAVALVASVASSEENQATRANEGDGSNDGGGASPEEFDVGDIVDLGEWRIQVHGFTDPYTEDNQFVSPAEGNRWVAVDAEVTNNSDAPEIVSSLLCFELLDGSNQAYTATITGGEAVQAPDGEVAPGESRRGTLVYELPTGVSDLRLSFKCDLLSTGSAVIRLS